MGQVKKSGLAVVVGSVAVATTLPDRLIQLTTGKTPAQSVKTGVMTMNKENEIALKLMSAEVEAIHRFVRHELAKLKKQARK